MFLYRFFGLISFFIFFSQPAFATREQCEHYFGKKIRENLTPFRPDKVPSFFNKKSKKIVNISSFIIAIDVLGKYYLTAYAIEPGTNQEKRIFFNFDVDLEMKQLLNEINQTDTRAAAKLYLFFHDRVNKKFKTSHEIYVGFKNDGSGDHEVQFRVGSPKKLVIGLSSNFSLIDALIEIQADSSHNYLQGTILAETLSSEALDEVPKNDQEESQEERRVRTKEKKRIWKKKNKAYSS